MGEIRAEFIGGLTRDSESCPMLAIRPTNNRSVYSGKASNSQNSGNVWLACNHNIFS